MSKYSIVVLLLILVLNVNIAQDDRLVVVATTTQAADLVTILSDGVDSLEVIGLMGAGVDPHLYQPTEADVAAMNRADVVIYSGLHLEGQFDTVFEALRDRNVEIYRMSQSVEDQGFVLPFFASGDETLDDPHFWFDPRNWQLVTEDLALELGQLDPNNADIYAMNAEAYVEQLDILYNWALEGMLSVDEDLRYLVTSHDAFQYFGDAFGWEMVAIQGISTQDEAGVGDIQSTVEFVLDNNIPVLFVESTIPFDTIESVQEAVDAAGGEVRIGVRQLYSDAMGEPEGFGGTYIGMIASNVYTILQSYDAAGATVNIPEWPADLTIEPPAELLEV